MRQLGERMSKRSAGFSGFGPGLARKKRAWRHMLNLWSDLSSRGVPVRASVRLLYLAFRLLVSLMRNTASSSLYYLTSLTSLLESIAHIIDQHQPVVDKYYGKKRMRTVVGRLVGESDRVVRNLVEGWEEERRVGRLVRPSKCRDLEGLG